ncbi:SRPBCC family protein [Hyphomonas oceanitis]|uniref:SRPBCC family protein n=1 Tax=Hyphomonas oceanitis TaxID=81033 RepID=UPI003001AF4E
MASHQLLPQHTRLGRPFLFVLAAGAIGAGAYGYIQLRRRRRSHASDSAPGRTSLAHRTFGGYAVTGRTITINKPRPDLYAYWRNFSNLPSFMQDVESVEEDTNGETCWTIRAPAGQHVTLRTEIVEDRKNELIAWRSTDASDIDTEGRVKFRDAPGNRGTEIEAIIAYKPPAGGLGRFIAKILQHEPKIQARRELKRFKMLMETGEVADPRHSSQQN